MKNKCYLVLLVLFISGSIYAQSDLQWLIKNNAGKQGTINNEVTGPNSYSNSPILNVEIIISGLSSPLAANSSFYPIRHFTNDFFGVFDDGSYHFGRYNTMDSHIASNNSSYKFSLNQAIKYLYLTNRYEEDDAPQNVVVGNGNGNGNGVVYIPQPITNVFNFNHDIVIDKDITMIIDGQNLRMASEECGGEQFKICYTAPNERNQSAVSFETSNFNTTNVIVQENNEVIDASSISFNNDQCFVFTPPADTGNMFINFKASINDNSVINDSVRFTLSCKNRTIASHSELISGYAHDPNFVKLNSICETNSGMYANYTFQVQNDGTDGTPDVSITIDFPPCIDINNIYLESYHFSNIQLAPITEINCEHLSNNKVTFHFPNKWELGYDSERIDPRSIASITVCARIKPSCESSFLSCDDCTLPTVPSSDFAGTPYSINMIIDLPTAKGDTHRPIENKCSCKLQNQCKSKSNSCWDNFRNLFAKKEKKN